MFARTYDSRVRVLGELHPATLTSLGWLGATHEDIGDYAEAEDCHRRALEARTKLRGPRHPRTSASKYRLGKVYLCMGEWTAAEKLLQEAYTTRRSTLGDEHPVRPRAPRISSLGLGWPMSCMSGYCEVINTFTVGFLTIPRASINGYNYGNY